MKRLIFIGALLGACACSYAQTPATPASTTAVPVQQQIEKLESAETAAGLALQFRSRGEPANEAQAWARAAKLRPHVGRYTYELAAVYAQQDKKREAYNALLELQTKGYAYDLTADKRFEKIHGTEVWTYIVQGFDSNREPFGEGKVAYTLPKQDLLIESLAWDPHRKRLLAGSAREGKVYIVEKDGRLQPLVTANDENGLWAVFDLAVDAERGVLWVASTAVPHFKHYDAETDLGRAGVFKFDLKTGKFLKKFLSPSTVGQAFFLSSLALGKNGELYAADGVNNAVYQVRDDQFRRLFHAQRLDSIRGMAVSADGRLLYLADHARGLIGYDLALGKPFDISVPRTLTLGGVDGVSWWQGQLIVVQNSMNPSRVMRLKLSDDGRSIASVHPIEANKPELVLPTLGTLAGDTFYFIANSQKGNYDRFGLLRDPKLLEPTRIYQVKADYVLPERPVQLPVPVTSK